MYTLYLHSFSQMLVCCLRVNLGLLYCIFTIRLFCFQVFGIVLSLITILAVGLPSAETPEFTH